MNMDHNYARSKLELLLRDLDHYTGEEFWRQMSRIAAGATGASHAEGLLTERQEMVAHVECFMGSLSRTVEAWKKEASEGDGIMEEHAGVLREARCLLSLADTPATSLGRMKEARAQEISQAVVKARREWAAQADPDYLMERDDEQFRQGFWWGFERARCHPNQMNIQSEYQEVAALRQQSRQVKETTE